MDYQCDKDISQNQKDPYTLELNSNVQNTPIDQEQFNNNFQTKKKRNSIFQAKIEHFFLSFFLYLFLYILYL